MTVRENTARALADAFALEGDPLDLHVYHATNTPDQYVKHHLGKRGLSGIDQEALVKAMIHDANAHIDSLITLPNYEVADKLSRAVRMMIEALRRNVPLHTYLADLPTHGLMGIVKEAVL